MKKRASLLLFVLTGVFSCQKHTVGLNKPLILPADGIGVVEANNQFALTFFQASLQQDSTRDNKLISPLSIYLALSMVYNGAGTSTKDSMAKALQLGSVQTDQLNAVNKALITGMPAEDSRVSLSIANSLWYRQGSIDPLPAYLDTVKNDYRGEARALNFNDPNAINTINQWVAQNTHNKIPTVIRAIEPTDMMFLIDAVYFKGSWLHAFETSDTQTGVFHLQGGNSVNTPFMQQTGQLRMFADSTLTLVELPYGSGNSYALELILPNNPQLPIDQFAASLDAGRLKGAISGLDTQRVQLVLPKWEYAYAIEDMRPALSTLGMGIAFNGGADFSGMYDASQIKLSISQAIHKTYIKVDEEGTEAAAVTGIGVGTTAIPELTPIKADHPFLYTILEKQSGSILFLGVVNDPSKN
ncbi:MAG: serpin family protein [Puia sp.]|nr:serpin family protein [Puia sp.]